MRREAHAMRRRIVDVRNVLRIDRKAWKHASLHEIEPALRLADVILRVSIDEFLEPIDLVEGLDGASWGGPRFTPSELDEGVLRVAGQDVPLDEWESEPARCPSVGLVAALAGGVATAVIAAVLWLVVRMLARAVRRSDPT